MLRRLARCATARSTLERTYATASAKGASGGDVQAPLQQFGTSGRYATALYVAATKAGSLAAVESEVAQVSLKARDERRARERGDGTTTARRGRVTDDDRRARDFIDVA